MDQVSNRLFIYGTLKRGGRLNGHLEGQKFLGDAKTSKNYRLYKIGWYPGLKRSEEGKQIFGELWEVDDKCLQNLDRVEGAPGLFKRDFVEIADSDEKGVESYFYNGDITKCQDVGTCWPVGGK